MAGGFIERGGLWVLGQNTLVVAVIVSGILWRGAWESLPLSVCGIVLLAAGAICLVAGLLALGRNLSPFPKPPARSQLVQAGIYGVVRHPLYTSLMAGSVGWALVCGSLPALVFALVLVILLDVKARREERWLRALFPDYAEP